MAPTLFSLQIKLNLYNNNPQINLRGAKVADGETNKNHLKPINLPITFILHLRGRGSIASKKPNSFNINLIFIFKSSLNIIINISSYILFDMRSKFWIRFTF